jgi:GDP-4-dehydro-6-deoxy-D-mannose reductase
MSAKDDFRILITGGDGFVAPFAAKAILSAIKDARILFTARRVTKPPTGCAFAELDILNERTFSHTLKEFRPTHILHLAGVASRAAAEANPSTAWDVNVCATLEMAQQLKTQCYGASFIFASSSQIYASNHDGLISELAPVGPTGVYSSTKAAADLALGAMASEGLKVIRFRPFNHTGPGQTESYALGKFATQIARIEAELQPPLMRVGNLNIQRDFLDVRDVADAYAQGIAHSHELPQDSLFNLASGNPKCVGYLLNTMLQYSRSEIDVQVDPNLLRGQEPEIIAGDGTTARKILNWNPARPIENTMREMVEFSRAKLVSQ